MGFLDNLKGTISQGADRVKFEAEKLQKTNRLRGEVGDLQQQINTNFGQLGQRAYELHAKGEISAPEIGSLVQIVNDLQQRLVATQQELERSQNEQYVQDLNLPNPAPQPPQPGGHGAPSGHYAGPQPGPEAGPVPPQPVEAGMYACTSCGFSLPAGSAFCPNCGARLNA